MFLRTDCICGVKKKKKESRMISVFCLGNWLFDQIIHNINEQDGGSRPKETDDE